ncbi:MAG: hypothetical protein MUF64_06005 [Polyangiaceae bacterium]|nr:hypothetical protein [Polyangiaceae bacterium]
MTSPRARIAGLLGSLLLACGPALAPTAAPEPSPSSASASSPSAPAPPPLASPGASAATSATAAGAPTTPAAPPPRDATVRWARNVVDHTTLYRLAPAPGGGLFVLGQSDSFLGARDDLFLTRLDAEGAAVWQHLGVGRMVRSIRASREDLYMLTEFSGRVRFAGMALAGGGDTSLLVARLAAKGEVAWGKVFDTPDFDRAAALAPMADGGVALAHGAFREPRKGATFRVAGGQDTLISRWGPGGELAWTRSLEWPGYDSAAGLVVHPDGILAAGTRWKSAETDMPGLKDRPCQGWVARLSPEGAIGWVKPLGEPERHTEVLAVAEAPGGSLLVAGTFAGRTTLGEVALDPALGKGFVARIDGEGTVRWARVIAAPTCLAGSTEGPAYVGAGREVLRVSEDGEIARVFVEPTPEARIDDCTLAGPERLYVSGLTKPGGSLGGKPIGPPMTNRSPAWMSTYEVAFAARLDL